MYKYYHNGEEERLRSLCIPGAVWDALDEFEEACCELEDVLECFRSVHEEVETALSDLDDGLAEADEHLDRCRLAFSCFREKRRKKRLKADDIDQTACPVLPRELPFPDAVDGCLP